MATAAKKTTTKRAPAKRAPRKPAAPKVEDLSIEELETLLAKRKESEKPKVESNTKNEESSVKYVRNLRGSEVYFRLTRQSDPTSKKLGLKPRGQRGDIARLMPEDHHDTVLIDQINHGLVEVISESEAREVMAKQSTNAHAFHPSLTGSITNPLGDPIHQSAIYHTPEPVQGATVLQDSSRMQNPIVREAVAPPTSPEAVVAHAPDAEVSGPAAGLRGNMTVTVAPVSTHSEAPAIPHI